jgi:hypothetical protein
VFSLAAKIRTGKIGKNAGIMANKPTTQILLRWSDHVPASDVQDPLGLGLRGSTRLASRLLYCITSITPRARYFSFIPWCIFDHQQREKGKPHALGLRDGIVIREQALTLACIAHHEGEPCAGGGLVGSRDAKKWFGNGIKVANFRKMKKFSKNPALGAYQNSLVNLGMFVTEEDRPDTDDEESEEDFTFDDIELSPLGLDLAKRFDQKTGGLKTAKQIASKDRCCSLGDLAEFGKHAGLCELPDKGSTDRGLLRDIFFALVESKGESHRVRRKSLLLTLDLCRQLSADSWALNEAAFAGAVYFGEVANEDERLRVVIPQPLNAIATRWRMFYFHHFMSVAFEGLFAWLVSQLGDCGLSGATVDSFVAQLAEPALRKNLSEILGIDFEGSFGELTPAGLFMSAGVKEGDLETVSKSFDQRVKSLSAFAEDSLEDLIRSNEHLYSSTGLALPLILLSSTLARYAQWETTDYGKWLANVANDPYLDLVPPLVTTGLARRFGSWWNTPYKDLAGFVLSRYVVQQHQAMSYEKTWTGERCLLQVDGPKIVSTGGFDKIGMGNPRFRSSVQILTDLGLIEDDENKVLRLTAEGDAFLRRQMAKEVAHEVS